MQGIEADFVAQIVTECGDTALCWGLWATLVNEELCKSVKEVLSDVTKNPVTFAFNPIPTLGKPMVGLVDTKKPRITFPAPLPISDPAPVPNPASCA